MGVRVEEDRCNSCGTCVRGCGMDVRHVGDHECIHCARCMDSCPRKCISLRAGGAVLKAPAGTLSEDGEKRKKTNGRIAWGVALAVLCSALLWFNFLDPSVRKTQAKPDITVTEDVMPDDETVKPDENEEPLTMSEEQFSEESESFESDAPVGKDVGMQLEDFRIECLDGSEFHLADCRGKVTVINLWATYCTPCVQELPHFSSLYREHQGDIAMLAVHSSLVTDDPEEYVADKNWAMPIAVDTDDDLIFNIVGGSSTLPQTIVLNRRGEVIYNEVRSVTPEMLAALYAQASQE